MATDDYLVLEWWNGIVEEVLDSSEFRDFRICGRVAGCLTLLGSSYIIQDVLKDATRRKATKNRIVLFMSCCDLATSLIDAIPQNMWAPRNLGIPGAVGNTITCTISGFLTDVSFVASAAYNVTLAFCYLLIVRYEFPDERLLKWEPYFLSIPLVWGILLGTPGLVLQKYNADGYSGCLLGPAPLSCDWPGSPLECTRGTQEFFLHSDVSLIIVINTEILLVMTCMALMFHKVLMRERSGDRFRFSPRDNTARARNRDLSNMMRNQGLWYSAAFILTFLPWAIYMSFIKGKRGDSWWLANLTVFFLRSIGFLNMIIYVRPRYVKFRRENPNVGILSSIWHTLARSRPNGGGRDGNTRGVTALGTRLKSLLSSLWRSLIGDVRKELVRSLRYSSDGHAAHDATTTTTAFDSDNNLLASSKSSRTTNEKEDIEVKIPIVASQDECEEGACGETTPWCYPGGVSVEEQAIDRSQHEEAAVKDWNSETNKDEVLGNSDIELGGSIASSS